MQIFLRTTDKPLELIEVDPDQTVATFLADRDAADAALWIEDGETALESSLPLAQAGVGERARVHISRCHKVAVTINYNGQKVHEFAPAATMGRVYDWAAGKKGFALSPTEKAKHTLAICDSETEPDPSEPVGALAVDCAACFDLVPKDRFAG